MLQPQGHCSTAALHPQKLGARWWAGMQPGASKLCWVSARLAACRITLAACGALQELLYAQLVGGSSSRELGGGGNEANGSAAEPLELPKPQPSLALKLAEWHRQQEGDGSGSRVLDETVSGGPAQEEGSEAGELGG